MVTKLDNHKLTGLNESLLVEARDNPGVDGACHLYRITVIGDRKDGLPNTIFPDIRFQDGSVEDVGGVNGLSDESLLAVVEHRLQGFQSGKYACEENEHALISLQNCILWLKKRIATYRHEQLDKLAKREKIETDKLPHAEPKPLVPVKEHTHAQRRHDRKNRKQG